MGVTMYDFDKRMELVGQMTDNILKKGVIKDREKAEQIAKRWMRYN